MRRFINWRFFGCSNNNNNGSLINRYKNRLDWHKMKDCDCDCDCDLISAGFRLCMCTRSRKYVFSLRSRRRIITHLELSKVAYYVNNILISMQFTYPLELSREYYQTSAQAALQSAEAVYVPTFTANLNFFKNP